MHLKWSLLISLLVHLASGFMPRGCSLGATFGNERLLFTRACIKMSLNSKAFRKFVREVLDGGMSGKTADEFTGILSERVKVDSMPIKELRRLGSYLASATSKTALIKPDDRLIFTAAMENYLVVEERSRPNEEHFPFTRADLDEMSKDTTALLKSVEALVRTDHNVAGEMKVGVCELFHQWLDSRQWEHFDVLLPGGRLLASKDTTLAQWDGIIAGSKGVLEPRLFLIETKGVAQSNDIYVEEPAEGPASGSGKKSKNMKRLYGKGLKTLRYLRGLSKDAVHVHGYGLIRQQENVLLPFAQAKVTVVYASGIINDEVKKALHKLQDRFDVEDVAIDVWYLECPRLSTCKVTTLGEETFEDDTYDDDDCDDNDDDDDYDYDDDEDRGSY